jgi:hypothetical protein
MEWDRGRSGGRELIDFASRLPSRGLEFNARLSVDAVTLKRNAFARTEMTALMREIFPRKMLKTY